MALNHITIMGRLTRDPELRFTPNQVPVTPFTLAVDRDYRSGTENQADFIDCVSWRSTAEFVSKHFSKGSMAIVEGRLQMRDYKDKNGNQRRAAEIMVESVYFGDSKKAQPATNEGYAEYNEDDLPY